MVWPHPIIIDCLMRVREPFNVNSVAQAGALPPWRTKPGLNGSCRSISKAGILVPELAAMGLDYAPTQGNFLFINLKTSGAAVSQRLMENGIIVRPGTFSVTPNISGHHGDHGAKQTFIEVLRKCWPN